MFSYSLTAFVCYFLTLLAIGIISHRKQTSSEEFIVGGRSLNFWLTALSAHASDMSAWLFMGLPTAVYVCGLSGSWIALGLLIGMFLNWHFIAAKLRIETGQSSTNTLSSFFAYRFKDSSGFLRVLTAVMLLYYLTHYLAAGLTAMGILIESVFSLNYYWGLTFATVVIVAYTFGGGFMTIAWTDLFQALFLLFVIILIPLLAIASMGGFEKIHAYTLSHPGYLNVFGNSSPKNIIGRTTLAVSWGLGYFGMPHVITKFMGIRDVNEMKKSMSLGMTWQFFALTASIAVGVVGAAFFHGSLANPQLVFVELVKVLCHPFVAGFVLCGVLAANMSTMDSQLLVCASAIGEDLYPCLFANAQTDSSKKRMRASRCGVLLIAAAALFIAFDKSETIIETVYYAWAGLGSAFGPLVLMSLYSKKANFYGAISGILVGGCTAAAWPKLSAALIPYDIPAMIPGFALSAASIYCMSRITSSS